MKSLKEMFNKSKNEIWEQIANDIGGDFIKTDFWGKDVLRYRHKEWEILLDTFSENGGSGTTFYTRLRAPFVNKDDLRFTIYREHIFTAIGKFFGRQDIQIWDKSFDDEFMIRGNNELKIKQLLNDQELKTLFKQQPKIYMEIKNDEGWFSKKQPENVNVLYFHCAGVMKDKEALHNLFNLFSAMLNRLVEIGSAGEDDPNFTVK